VSLGIKDWLLRDKVVQPAKNNAAIKAIWIFI